MMPRFNAMQQTCLLLVVALTALTAIRYQPKTGEELADVWVASFADASISVVTIAMLLAILLFILPRR